jgi:hypothetical protein
VKQVSHKEEEKLTALTPQRVKEIVEIEKAIIKEFTASKEASKKLIQERISVQHA